MFNSSYHFVNVFANEHQNLNIKFCESLFRETKIANVLKIFAYLHLLSLSRTFFDLHYVFCLITRYRERECCFIILHRFTLVLLLSRLLSSMIFLLYTFVKLLESNDSRHSSLIFDALLIAIQCFSSLAFKILFGSSSEQIQLVAFKKQTYVCCRLLTYLFIKFCSIFFLLFLYLHSLITFSISKTFVITSTISFDTINEDSILIKNIN